MCSLHDGLPWRGSGSLNLTKVIRLEGTILAWEEFQRSSYCFTQNGGVPGESADVQPAWWLDLKATSDERMCCADGYESLVVAVASKSILPIFNDCQLFFGVNRHPKGIESKGLIYVPIFSCQCDYYNSYHTWPRTALYGRLPALYTMTWPRARRHAMGNTL